MSNARKVDEKKGPTKVVPLAPKEPASISPSQPAVSPPPNDAAVTHPPPPSDRSTPEGRRQKSRPLIFVDAQPRDIRAKAFTSLLEALPGQLYLHRGKLVCAQLRAEGLFLAPLTSQNVLHILIEHADWVRIHGGVTTPVWPPKPIATMLLQADLADPVIPPINAILNAPGFCSGFRLLLKRGYDVSTGVFVSFPESLEMSEIPMTPSADELAASITLLRDELLADFPFAKPSDMAHALALFLLPFIRLALPMECTPLHDIESPTPGTGKSLLAKLVAVVANGEPCAATSFSAGRNELRKKLTALLAQGNSMILFDNLPTEQLLNSDSLASILTAPTWTDRPLGTTSMPLYINEGIWMMTGNNPRFTGELARRTVRIRLTSALERPWERPTFRHPDIIGWAKEHRAELIRALLILVQNWLAKGQPLRSEMPLGSFERWSNVMGGILEAAGVEGFLADRESFYDEASADHQEWSGVTEAWWRKHASTRIKAAQLAEICLAEEMLVTDIGNGSKASQCAKLGRLLATQSGRIFGGYRICKDSTAKLNSARYFLEPMNTDATEGDLQIQ